MLLVGAATAQTFTATGSLAQARAQATAAVLADGEVLVAGGQAGGSALRSAEPYDPATGTFHAAGNMLIARAGAQSVRLANGTI